MLNYTHTHTHGSVNMEDNWVKCLLDYRGETYCIKKEEETYCGVYSALWKTRRRKSESFRLREKEIEKRSHISAPHGACERCYHAQISILN